MAKYAGGKTYNSGATYQGESTALFGSIAYFDPITPASGQSVEQSWVSIEIEHPGSTNFSLGALVLYVMPSAQTTPTHYAPTEATLRDGVSVEILHAGGTEFILRHTRLDVNTRSPRRPVV